MNEGEVLDEEVFGAPEFAPAAAGEVGDLLEVFGGKALSEGDVRMIDEGFVEVERTGHELAMNGIELREAFA